MSDDSARPGSPSVTPPATDGWTVDEGGRMAGAAGPEKAGETIPRYRNLGLIGIGGMGVVYRAEDTRLGRTVALKFLPPMLTPNPRAKARFLDEARAASALDHPNICTVYEVGETAEGQLYLAMAHYGGETLKRRLEAGPLSVTEALDITLQVARGLAKAHQHGIVHRDIKPANLMITADGIVKILDFGIARLPDPIPAGPALGTPGYMSPEQARGRAAAAPSDVWSLGVVLCEMMTGLRLDPDGAGTGGKDRSAPPLPRDAPPGLAGILSRMLAEEPADRYPDAVALLADLSALERLGLGTAGVRASGFKRWIPAAAAVALAAGLALAAAAGLFGSAFRRGGAVPVASPTFTQLTDLAGKEWFPSLAPDGNFVVYARKAGERNRLFWQRVGGSARDLPHSPAGDSQPAISPDGQQIAFRSERDGGGIFLMGVTGESVRRVTNFGFNPAWSSDGQEIVFATEGVVNPLIRRLPRSEIFRFHLATHRLRRIETEDAVQPSWSPNGWRIAYWGVRSGRRILWTVPADGGTAVQVTDGEQVDWNPVWAPDGHHLYFVSDRGGMPNLWRLRIDERSGQPLGAAEPVTQSDQTHGLLSLSGDGRRIAYASDESKASLEKVPFDPVRGETSGPAATLTQGSKIIRACDVSPDGSWLVYHASVPREELYVLRSDGSEPPRQLTDDRHIDRQPRWSPVDDRIAFYSNRSGDNWEVWLIGPDGSQPELAAAVPRDRRAVHPIWSPDGRRLVCDLEETAALIDLGRPFAERLELLPKTREGLAFSASSWSRDGRWLAGALHEPGGSQLPGVVLYSLTGRRYVRITAGGRGPTWLSDSRHLLYWDGGKLLLLDIRTRKSREVLDTPPGSSYQDLCVSPDDRFLYLARSTEEVDIWLLTMKEEQGVLETLRLAMSRLFS